MSVAVCALCIGVAAPATVAATTPVFESTVATAGPAVDDYTDVLPRWVDGQLDDALVVVVPGTDDDRYPRVNGIVGGRDSAIVTYPESFWPVISGRSGRLPFLAPTYDRSRDVAVANTLTVMEALQDADRVVVYTGYSQGSDALGNAAELAAARGLLGPDSTILLVSDPRGPWGVKSKLSDATLASGLLRVIGIVNDGARDPAATGDAEVVHVIIQGDPVVHAQWDWTRPVSSFVVDVAGFLAIHSDQGRYTYAHVENLEHVRTLTSEDGNSTYEIYDTYHPLVLLNAMILGAVGVRVSEAQLATWDRVAEAFYPTQEITAANADPKARVVEAPLSAPAVVPESARGSAPDPVVVADEPVAAQTSETDPSPADTVPDETVPEATELAAEQADPVSVDEPVVEPETVPVDEAAA
ncbi:hypothetical protein SCNU_08801 [Gordonia neofelifaecis NRRL B-59395]|uniref:Uncharacterized protein n=1 Tax=Gordonia neofelifaecis NRRL B-59395 TaxID=644548 RepID=F1YIN6_9ACTN|nr:hypothetical protein SCNU_08801 [Gordonia neofelifaecis NRRL B-59395]